MIKRMIACTAMIIVHLIPCSSAHPGPFGFSVKGGIGMGYYSMDDLNNHIREVRQNRNAMLDEISGGININIQGRLWLFDQIALSAGYEHLWGNTEGQTIDYTITYKTPADIYTIGGVANILSLPTLIDLNIGGNVCMARSVYGTNLLTITRLKEYKGNENGYELFAEVATNFLRPVEVGFQLGYRGLKIKELEDKGIYPAQLEIARSVLLADGDTVKFFEGEGAEKKEVSKSINDAVVMILEALPKEARIDTSEKARKDHETESKEPYTFEEIKAKTKEYADKHNISLDEAEVMVVNEAVQEGRYPGDMTVPE